MEKNKREKKITVKFFLNKAVEPILNGTDRKSYPLYIQVTYNRRNMQFKSRYSGEYYESLDGVKPSLLKFEERIIKNIVTYEASRERGYELIGLKKKYNIYSVSIMEALEHYLRPKLRLAVQKTNNDLMLALDFSSSHATVQRLYKASGLLFKNFDSYLPQKLKEDIDAYNYYMKLYRPVLTYNFPTLIDWVDGSYKPTLKEKIREAYKNKSEWSRAVEDVIDAAVARKLRELEKLIFCP